MIRVKIFYKDEDGFYKQHTEDFELHGDAGKFIHGALTAGFTIQKSPDYEVILPAKCVDRITQQDLDAT